MGSVGGYPSSEKHGTMPVALVIETQPEIAAFAVAAFKHVGLDAFAVRLSRHAVGIMEISGDVSVVLLNMNGNYKDQAIPRMIVERWPEAVLIILTDRLSSLRDLPPSFVLLKPAPSKTLLTVINRAALASALIAKSPKRRKSEPMSICLDEDVANCGKLPI